MRISDILGGDPAPHPHDVWAERRAQAWISATVPDGWDLETGDAILSRDAVYRGFWADVRDLERQVREGEMPMGEAMSRMESLMRAALAVWEHTLEHARGLP